MHTNDLRQGKGLEGTDADVFDRDGPVDQRAFVQRARPDGHQLRGMVSLDAGDRADWHRFLPRLMAQFEANVGSRMDWLGAVHHAPGVPRPAVHAVRQWLQPRIQGQELTR
jgi:hypothetical protein